MLKTKARADAALVELVTRQHHVLTAALGAHVGMFTTAADEAARLYGPESSCASLFREQARTSRRLRAELEAAVADAEDAVL